MPHKLGYYSNFQRKPEGRKTSHLFCDHCKKQGHTVDKCYKLHGYPPRQQQSFKTRTSRFANNAWTEGDGQTEISEQSLNNSGLTTPITSASPITQPILPGLDAEQSKQLLHFLANLHANKQPLGESSSSQKGFSTAYMAGIHSTSFEYAGVANSICCTCKLDGKIWIVDSGASDHMVFDKTLLHNIRPLKDPILITLPNGNKVKVSQVGDLNIWRNLVLHHTLFVHIFSSIFFQSKSFVSN